MYCQRSVAHNLKGQTHHLFGRDLNLSAETLGEKADLPWKSPSVRRLSCRRTMSALSPRNTSVLSRVSENDNTQYVKQSNSKDKHGMKSYD